MDILKWLDELGLSRYADTFSEFPIEDIIEFTDDDFKELGVLTPHRKKLLIATASLNKNISSSEDTSSSVNTETASSFFSNFIKVFLKIYIQLTSINIKNPFPPWLS